MACVFVLGFACALSPSSVNAQSQTSSVASAKTSTTSRPKLAQIQAGKATNESKEDGPKLELEGLNLQEIEGASGQPTGQTEEIDPFKDRTDPLTTLADRARAIIDRTTIGGYGEHEFITGQGEVSRFVAHRYIIFVYSQISERISTATEIEFEFAGSPKKTDGNLGFGEVLLEFSVVDLKLYDWLNFRAGIILMPVSAFNLRHDAPTRDISERPIAYTTVVPSTWFESGAGFLGTIELGESQRLTYELYLVNGLDARIFDGFGLRAARGSHFEDNNHDKALTGRVAWSPTLGFELGLSGYTGAYDKRQSRVNLVNLDFLWRMGDLEFLGEGVFVNIDEGFVEGFEGSSQANTRDPVPQQMMGFYLQANYHFTIPPLWSLLPEWLNEATFTGVLRYEGMDTDFDQHSAAGDRRRLTLGLNFRPIEPYVIKTDYRLESNGVDGVSAAPDLWKGDFWTKSRFTFMASVAFLF